MKIIDMEVTRLLKETRKPTANPGGGAVVILIGALAVNLIRMMDRVSHETLDVISQRLEELIQEDVDVTNDLLRAYKQGVADEEIFLKAADPQIELVDLCIKALEQISEILEKGRKETLSDGIIANNLLLEIIKDAIPTIEVNLINTSKEYDYEGKVSLASQLHLKNTQIIERRKQV